MNPVHRRSKDPVVLQEDAKLTLVIRLVVVALLLIAAAVLVLAREALR